MVLERAPRSARISITATQIFLAINVSTAVSAAAAIIPSAIPFALHTPGSPAAVAVMRAYIILGAALSIIAATAIALLWKAYQEISLCRDW